MSSYLKTGGFYEQDDFVEDSGQLRELTVTITLSEYRELVALSVQQRDFIAQIDDLTEAADFLCRSVLELAPDVRNAVKRKVPPAVFAALFRVAKDGDADA